MNTKTRRNLRTELSALLWGRQETKGSVDQILRQVAQLKSFRDSYLDETFFLGEARKPVLKKPKAKCEDESLARWVLDNIS